MQSKSNKFYSTKALLSILMAALIFTNPISSWAKHQDGGGPSLTENEIIGILGGLGLTGLAAGTAAGILFALEAGDAKIAKEKEAAKEKASRIQARKELFQFIRDIKTGKIHVSEYTVETNIQKFYSLANKAGLNVNEFYRTPGPSTKPNVQHLAALSKAFQNAKADAYYNRFAKKANPVLVGAGLVAAYNGVTDVSETEAATLPNSSLSSFQSHSALRAYIGEGGEKLVQGRFREFARDVISGTGQ